MRGLEMRHVSQPVEFRSADSGPGTLDGYAAVFNRYSQNLGGFVEVVAPGAFSKSVADGVSVVARYNHDDNFLLGTTEAGTLTLSIDDTGLRYVVDLPDTSTGRDVAALSKRGDVRYSSFAFHTIEDEWGTTEQGFPLRTLKSVQLVDVAPVNSPAYKDTSVGMRSLAEHLNVEVDVVEAATTEELRSLINGEPVELPNPEKRSDDEQAEADRQRETHLMLALRRRALELEEKK